MVGSEPGDSFVEQLDVPRFAADAGEIPQLRQCDEFELVIALEFECPGGLVEQGDRCRRRLIPFALQQPVDQQTDRRVGDRCRQDRAPPPQLLSAEPSTDPVLHCRRQAGHDVVPSLDLTRQIDRPIDVAAPANHGGGGDRSRRPVVVAELGRQQLTPQIVQLGVLSRPSDEGEILHERLE